MEHIEIVLNGGKNEMDAATIPIQWFFSSEFAAQKPTYVIIVEQNQQEIENDTYGHMGRRYICKVSEVVKFIQLFSPGLHRVAVVAFAGQNAKEVADEYMITSRRDNYEKSLRLDYIENPERFSAKKVETQQEDEDDYEDFDTSAKELDLIATCVRFMVPAELFAKKPETKWGKMMWQYVNTLFDKDPQDECAYRKRKIFAFTLQPILFLLYFILKYLLAGTLYAIYVLLGSIFVWFFGYEPVPIFKHMKLAWLWKDRQYRNDRWYSNWSVLQHHLYRKIQCTKDYKGIKEQAYSSSGELFYRKRKIVPWHLAFFTFILYGSIKSIIEYWDLFLAQFSLLVILLIGAILFAFIAYKVIKLSGVEKFFAWLKKRNSKKQEMKKIKRQQTIIALESEQAEWEKRYQKWLQESLNISNKPSHVDLKHIPKPLLKAERTVQHFRISFWSLKIKVCRPFNR